MSPSILLFPTPPPRRPIRHPIPKSRQALLSAMRRHLLAQIEPSRIHRRRLFRHHLPPHAVHGLPPDDPEQRSARGEQQRCRGQPECQRATTGSTHHGRERQYGGGGDQGGEVRAEDLWV